MSTSPGTNTIDSVQIALINAGLGQDTDSAAEWMIYKWSMPDSDPAPSKTVADRAICLYDSPGRPAEEGFMMDYPDIQVVVRGNPDDFRAVRDKCQDIFLALHAQEPSIGAAFVYFYSKQSAPLSLGIDQRRRLKMAWNFRSMRNRAT